MAKLNIVKIMSTENHTIDSLPEFLEEKGMMFGGKMTIPALVKINGKSVFFKDWINHKCANDDVIEYQLLAGDPGTSAAISSTIASFFSAAKALYTTSTFFAAGVNAVASLAVNKIASLFVKNPKSVSTEERQADNVYSFSGNQNVIAPGQPKALLHGERRGLYPEIMNQDFVSITYEDGQSVNGDPLRKRSNQMLNMLLFIASGDCAVSNVTVEDTKFSALVNSEFEVIPPNGDITGFNRLIAATELSDIELFAWNEEGGTAVYGANEGWIGKDDGIIINPYGTEIDTIFVSLEFLLGKAHNNDPSIINPLTAVAEMQVVKVDKDGTKLGSWVDVSSITAEINYFNGSLNLILNNWVTLLGHSTFGHKVFANYGYYEGKDPYLVTGSVAIDSSDYELDTSNPLFDKLRVTALPDVSNINPGAIIMSVTLRNYTYVNDNQLTAGIVNTGADITPYVRQVSFPVEKGRYAIRARRSDQKDLEVTARHQIRLVGVQGRNVRAYDNSNCTLLRVKLQASKQLSSQTSNQIKVDAYYKNSTGGIENRAGELIKRLINGDAGVMDPQQINANYPALEAFQNNLDLKNTHINCRITKQQSIGEFLDDVLSELRAIKYVKASRLEFVRDSYPTLPEATFTADKVIAGSLSETFNLPNDNKAGVIIGHYWDNDERRARKIKLKPQGSKTDIETEIQFKYLSNIDDVIKQLYYVAQNNLMRLIPNTITVGEEGLDLRPSAHINIALPRISDAQSVQINSYNEASKLLCLNVQPLIDETKTYVIVLLSNLNMPADPIEIMGFDGPNLILASDPLTPPRTNLSQGNRTRAIIHEINYQMERRLVQDIQVSNSDNKIFCELSTVDDYPEVHAGTADIWIDEAVASRKVTTTEAGEVFYDDWVDNLTLVLNGSNLNMTWGDYPLSSEGALLISGYEIIVSTLSQVADPVTGYYFTDQNTTLPSGANTLTFVMDVGVDIENYTVLVKPLLLDNSIDGGSASDKLDNPNFMAAVPWVPDLAASYTTNGDGTRNITVTYNPHPSFNTDFRFVQYSNDGSNFAFPIDAYATPPYNNVSADADTVLIEYMRVLSSTPFSASVLDSITLELT